MLGLELQRSHKKIMRVISLSVDQVWCLRSLCVGNVYYHMSTFLQMLGLYWGGLTDNY